MSKLLLDDAISRLSQSPGAYCTEAYQLVNAALNHTLISMGITSGKEKHVSGGELCLGFRDYVLKEYGPISYTMLDEWGIHTTGDVGEIVFQFIDVGYYSQSDRDRVEDFEGVFDFIEAFIRPFEPKAPKLPV